MTMKKLRVGVIGLGMGKAHIKGYQKHAMAEVVAVADLDRKRLDAAKLEFAIPSVYTSADEMLAKESLDVVSVATPNTFHKPLTLAALKAGAHVLCEKPMAMDAGEARDMRAAAEAAGRRLMINFSFRFTPQSWALKREVDGGLLGDVYFAQTRWLRRRGMPGFGGWFGQKALAGGGPLIDLGVHRIDLALWLMGYPEPDWVMGATYNHIAAARAKAEGKAFDVEDFATALIRFKNGATLDVQASWAGNIKQRELMETRLLGTAGGLLQHNVGEGYDFEAEMYIERNGCQFDLIPHAPIPNVGSAMEHFIESIVTGVPHVATADEGVTVMDLLDAIYASAAQGKPVHIGARTAAAAGH